MALGLCLLAPLVWYGNPAIALLAGGALALGVNRQAVPGSATLARYALQTAIVLLGLKLNLNTLWELSAQYAWIVAAYVLSSLAAGLALGRMLKVESVPSRLISAGTAICGGTAIATLSAVLRARPQHTAVALAIVFLLNVVALLTFPLIGRALGLTDLQFGLWAALAIHDTSSVVATAAVFGERAAEIATTIKLGRTLWLIPLVLVASAIEERRQEVREAGPQAGSAVPRLRVPWFVVLFVGAAAAGTLLPLPEAVPSMAGAASGALLVVALFLVGTELTRDVARQIRGRVVWQALGLWLLVIPGTLALAIWLG